jgi:hypothetical protein
MCCILLGLIMDLLLPSGVPSSWIIRAVHALLNFLQIEQFLSHTTETPHFTSRVPGLLPPKQGYFFIDLGICEHFNFPKLHSLLHYQLLITLFGTTDNYDTEQTKQLHINFTKNCFCATNHKDKYPQMTAWVECCEKVEQHVLFIAWWQQAQQQGEEYSTPIGTPVPAPCALQMT